MTSTTHHLENVLPTEGDVAAYREHGYWLSGIVLPGEVLDAAQRGMQRFYAGARDRPGPAGVEGDGWRPEHGDGLRKNDYASLRIDELAALVASPAIGAIATRLSGAAGIRLWHDQLLFKPVDTPGRPANVGWHTDRQYWETCTSQEMLTAWVPFHDVDEDGGSITFIDASHRWDAIGLDFFASNLDRQEAALAAAGRTVVKAPAVLKRGQLSFHHCRTIHGSGPNRATQPRRSLAIHLQPTDNHYQRHTLSDNTVAHHRNDDLCRRAGDRTPDYADPALSPSSRRPLQPATGDRFTLAAGRLQRVRARRGMPSGARANMCSMRWDEQTVEADERARLPGHADTAVVRRFDAPEALETRFYEVRAKSALNRVPAGSRVPFGWTINPYRGCSHACTYCVLGDTAVLTADGRTRPIRHVRPGDRIYGTVQRGAYRRYAITEILDHWVVRKPAYRVTLESGTDLITSADHRFLTEHGWKHVIGAEHGPRQRPHLTLNSKLMGTGAFAEGPTESSGYKSGYLCGAIRRDGDLSTRVENRPGGRAWEHAQFRLALTDFEALARAQAYLDDLGVETRSFQLAAVQERGCETHASRASSRRSVSVIREFSAWPRRVADDWCKGFLAGSYDADGSFSSGGVRICSMDATTVDWITLACRRLGVAFIVENVREGICNVRIRGGLEHELRFLHLTDPAVTRKRSIEGRAVKSQSRLEVASVEPLGVELPLYDITTGTGDFIANGVVSHNCFARPTHEYLEFDAGRDFEREIVVKVNVPEVLRSELARPSWKREHIAMGTNTDPYQWVEGRYKLMRGIWEVLRDAANPCSILTKSPLLLRDLDLMLEVSERTDVSACLSVPTLDEKAWRASEPHTPHPRARLDAVAKLNAAGIPTGILIAPLMPGVNDAPEQVERIIALAREAGAVSIGGQTLFLRGAVREIYFDWLRSYRPELVPRYEQLYARGAYMPERERREIERAAGLPGARLKADPERFRHRSGLRRPAPAPATKEVVRQQTLF